MVLLASSKVMCVMKEISATSTEKGIVTLRMKGLRSEHFIYFQVIHNLL